MKEFVLSSSSGESNLKINYADELNEQQLDVVKGGDGPCLVLAGAGSGKTRTITYRVAWLLEHGVAPQNILLLTFTNKASREMIGRVESLLQAATIDSPQPWGAKGGPTGLWAGTFHSIANRILRHYADRVGFAPNFSILDQEDSRELVSLCVKELKIDTKDRRFPSATVLRSMISFAANKGCGMDAAVEMKHPKFLPILSEIEAVTRMYHRLKHEQNAMDFDDLLIKLLELLTKDETVRSKLSNQFEYVLVDEFQDTNVIQARIVHFLSRAHCNLLVVGDDAQSIYSFRAAEIRNILDFPKHNTGTKTFSLTTNYRSTPQILGIANKVIANNKEQFKKELAAVLHDGDRPLLVPAKNQIQEAQYIAEQILDLQNAGSALREMSVLFRAAFHSQALEFELMKRDVPYEYRGGLKFFERAHVKDAVAHLRLFHNLKDTMAWIRCLKIHPGLGMVTANKIGVRCGLLEDIQDVRDADVKIGARAQAGWAGFLRLLNGMLAGPRTPTSLIESFKESEEYQVYLEHEYPNFRDRLDDLEQFALFAEQYEKLDEFLEAVSLTSEYGAARKQDDVEEDRLILSTIHQAKGLEWDHVFVMHLNDGSFPSGRSMGEKGGLEEERRLFYVAITRARRKLYLTYPLTSGFDTLEIKSPSVFLDEIPQGALETVKLKTYQTLSSSFSHSSSNSWEEPTIVLDDLGEREKKVMPSSFLRNIDEL